MPAITFDSEVIKIGPFTLLRLPANASGELPSRGMAMVKGTLNGAPLLLAAEPDGKGGHWLKLDSSLLSEADVNVGDTVTLEIEPTKEWAEPEVPADLKEALAADPRANALWPGFTTAARWDWIRWINATGSSETRGKRIRVALSKMNAGMRRPCCFNRSMCTVPEVSRSGVLLDT